MTKKTLTIGGYTLTGFMDGLTCGKAGWQAGFYFPDGECLSLFRPRGSAVWQAPRQTKKLVDVLGVWGNSLASLASEEADALAKDISSACIVRWVAAA